MRVISFQIFAPNLNSELPTQVDAKGLQKMGVGFDQRKGSFQCTDETVHLNQSGGTCRQPFVSKGCERIEEGGSMRQEKESPLVDFRKRNKSDSKR